MTIKELEQRVNMPRTNIRFYEQEGLLSPVRHPNGYRDYSEADVETLEKIRLLRRLHLDLDTIRALQSGELSLPDALGDQLTALETDRDALTGAVAVCRRLREEGTAYSALRPQPWLEELDRAPASERFALPEDNLPSPAGHPWRRYFARCLDLSLYSLPISAVELLVFHIPFRRLSQLPFSLLNLYLGLALMLLLEPLFLHFWGTTPGKAAFGITLRNAQGEKLPLGWAWLRTWEVFSQGMGFGIPFYSIYRQAQQGHAIRSGDRADWEWGQNGRLDRLAVPGSLPHALSGALCCALTFLLSFLLLRQSLLPPNRGGLTREQFVENYNFYVDALALNTFQLNTLGQPIPSPYTIREPEARDGRWTFLQGEDGTLTQVTWAADYPDDYVEFSLAPQYIGLLAYAGAQEESSCLNFSLKGWYDFLFDQAPDCEAAHRQVHLSRQLDIPDFEFVWKIERQGIISQAYHTPDGEDAPIRWSFVLTKAP